MNNYIAYEINLWTYPQDADFLLSNFSFGSVKLTKNSNFGKNEIVDMVLDLMLAEAFRYLIVVGFVNKNNIWC